MFWRGDGFGCGAGSPAGTAHLFLAVRAMKNLEENHAAVPQKRVQKSPFNPAMARSAAIDAASIHSQGFLWKEVNCSTHSASPPLSVQMICKRKPKGAAKEARRSSTCGLFSASSEERTNVTEAVSPSASATLRHRSFSDKKRQMKPESPSLDTLMLP
jgi:hypothetical protein